MKSEHLVRRHRRSLHIRVPSTYFPCIDRNREGFDTAAKPQAYSQLSGHRCLQVRGRESPPSPEILPRVSIIETHYSRSIICGRSQRLIISSRPIDYSNVREIVLSSPFTVLSRRLRKD